MEIYRSITDYLTSNGGKLPTNVTWFDVAEKFNIEPPDPERARLDPLYDRKARARKAQRVWEDYLVTKNDLKLTKEVYKDGALATEVFTRTNPVKEINYDDFEIERFSSCSNGITWFKGRRKEGFYDEDHFAKLRELLKETVTPKVAPDFIHLDDLLSRRKNALMVYSSDKHIGALTKDSSIYTNHYTEEVMYDRIVRGTLHQIEDAVAMVGKLDHLYIMDLGDALDGFNQKTTGGLRGSSSHTLPQQYNNREQHDIYFKLHKELFELIYSRNFAFNVYYIATSNSNHGGDFEYGAMRTLEEYLKLRHPSIKTHINTRPLNHFFYDNHCIVFGHGKDDEDMKHGLPLNLNDKVEAYISDYLTVNKLHDYDVTFVTGDLHQSSKNYGKNFRYRKVLSQYGGSKWIHTNYGSSTAGISTEILTRGSAKVIEMDDFFSASNVSNTGIVI